MTMIGVFSLFQSSYILVCIYSFEITQQKKHTFRPPSILSAASFAEKICLHVKGYQMHRSVLEFFTVIIVSTGMQKDSKGQC